MTFNELSLLLPVARKSIESYFETKQDWLPELSEYPDALREIRASFVTLNLYGELRGCIGSLTARYPLVNDVAIHAVAAAFSDPRFPPLTREEFPNIELHVSALTPPVDFPVKDRDDLLERLRPGTDGLVLQVSGYQATFLPSVWEQLPEPVEFVGRLFRKAGLPYDFWSPDVIVQRYEVEDIADHEVTG